jgi:hypothetical protein
MIKKEKSAKKSAPSNHLVPNSRIKKRVKFERLDDDVQDCIADCSDQYTRVVKRKKSTDEALYEFLQALYIATLNAHGKLDELKQLAQEMNIACNARTDLFALVLKLALSDLKVDPRRISEYANTLRYLYSKDVAGEKVARKLKKLGGIAGCRKRLAKRRKRMTPPQCSSALSSDTRKECWNKVKSDGSFIEIKQEAGKTKGEKLRRGRYVLFAGKDQKGVLRIYKSISINDDLGKQILRRAVN